MHINGRVSLISDSNTYLLIDWTVVNNILWVIISCDEYRQTTTAPEHLTLR